MTKAFACKYLGVLRDALNRQSGGGGGGDIDLTQLDVTANGVYNAPAGTAYDTVDVAVPGASPFEPAAARGYTALTLYSDQSVAYPNLSDLVTAVENPYTIGALVLYITPPAQDPVTGDLVCLTGKALDTNSAEVDVKFWGVVLSCWSMGLYYSLMFSSVQGISYDQSGIQTEFREPGAHTAADGSTITTINLAPAVELTPYKPKTADGYRALSDTQTASRNNLSNLITAFTNNNRGNYISCNRVTSNVPQRGAKVCITGRATDGSDLIPYTLWGTVWYWSNMSGYAQCYFLAFHGFSYVQNGLVKTMIRHSADTADTAGDGLKIFTAVEAYAYSPYAGYTEKTLDRSLSKNNLESYWSSKSTSATYALASGSTAAVGEHVCITGWLSDQDSTKEYGRLALWGVVGTVSGTTITLSEYHGMSWARKNYDTDAIEGKTYILEGGDYLTQAIGGQTLNVQDALGDFLQGVAITYEDTSITSVRDHACYGAKYANLELPNVTVAGIAAFAQMVNCNIQLPALVTGHDHLFYHSSGITQLKLPALYRVYNADESTNNGEYAFAAMTNLVYAYLPALGWLPGYAFKDCPSLKRVEFNHIGQFWYNVFDGCTALEEVVISGTYSGVPELSAMALLNAPSGIKFYVPDAMLNDFKTATNWSSIASDIYPISDLTNYTPGSYTPA